MTMVGGSLVLESGFVSMREIHVRFHVLFGV